MLAKFLKTHRGSGTVSLAKLYTNKGSYNFSTGYTKLLREQAVNTIESISSTEESRSSKLSRLDGWVYPPTANIASKREKLELLSAFPKVIQDLRQYYSSADLGEATDHYIQMLEYNLPNGRLTSGLLFVAAYKAVQSSKDLTAENIRLVNILAWCLEMLKIVWVISDDIIDVSEFRTGKLCWYKKEEIGLQAINDVQLLENGAYYILKKYLSHHRYYVPILELFHEAHMLTAAAQGIDAWLMVNGKPQLEKHTMDLYTTHAEYKATYNFVGVPVFFALYFADKYNKNMFQSTDIILRKLGCLYSVQADIQDCFGNFELTGKFGSDIREGRRTWLNVTALQLATPAQRQILEENYGRPEPERVATVRALYEELDIFNAYLAYQKEQYRSLYAYISQHPEKQLSKLLLRFLNLTCGRLQE